MLSFLPQTHKFLVSFWNEIILSKVHFTLNSGIVITKSETLSPSSLALYMFTSTCFL